MSYNSDIYDNDNYDDDYENYIDYVDAVNTYIIETSFSNIHNNTAIVAKPLDKLVTIYYCSDTCYYNTDICYIVDRSVYTTNLVVETSHYHLRVGDINMTYLYRYLKWLNVSIPNLVDYTPDLELDPIVEPSGKPSVLEPISDNDSGPIVEPISDSDSDIILKLVKNISIPLQIRVIDIHAQKRLVDNLNLVKQLRKVTFDY